MKEIGVEFLVQIQVPAADAQLCMYTGRNASDWILVTVVSNGDSHRGSHVCICSSSQETTDPKTLLFQPLFNPWTQIPLPTLKKEKERNDYLSLLIKSNGHKGSAWCA